MTRMLFALLLLGGCLESHPAAQQELANQACYTCHVPDYDATDHAAKTFPTSCADCHRTSAWQPSLEGLHLPPFVIASGRHAGIACLTCHDLDKGSSKMGANTTCVDGACHHSLSWSDGFHRGEVGTYTGIRGDASNRHFCLDARCHPDGLVHDN